MDLETRNCQNCKSDFAIAPEDFVFYEKMQVPAPTWCPECRLVRRFVWRNERSLYFRECGLCHKKTMAMYPKDSPYTVYCVECWRGDNWDRTVYGQDYDFTKPFFEQFRTLLPRVPRAALAHNGTNLNSDYSNYTQASKNVYYSFSSVRDCEDVYYSQTTTWGKTVFDSTNVTDSQTIFQSLGGLKNYQCKYAYWSANCMDCAFILDSSNCLNCLGCASLKNKSYYIFNEQYSKEEYEKKLSEFRLDTYSGTQAFEKMFWEFSRKAIRRFARITNCQDSTGDELNNCRNVKNSFSVLSSENIRFGLRFSANVKDAMDANNLGYSELVYEHCNGGSEQSQNIKFISYGSIGQINTTYCDYCYSSSDLFGCVGLKNAKFCILNKQYSEEEYKALVPKIIRHMNDMPYVDTVGRTYKYGELFPPEFSTFGYNETLAQEYFPLSAEEAGRRGYRWRNPEPRTHQPTIMSENLPDSINDVPDSIVNEIIGCAHAGSCQHQCSRAFKIIPVELAQYRKIQAPLPRLCPNCRHYERLAKRNPLKLWHRNCMCGGSTSANGTYQNTASHMHHEGAPCPNSFETSYPPAGEAGSPDRPEIVYCEQCYQQEIS